MKTISLLCPSRGRPEMFAEMIKSAVWSTACPEAVEYLRYIDRDDPSFYPSIDMVQLVDIRGHRHKIAKLYNCLATIATGDILFAVNDDVIFRTQGWDNIIRAHMPEDGLAVMYPNDMFNRQCTFPIIGRQWLDATGQLLSERFDWWYGDTWLADIAQRIGRLIPLPIIVEHFNPLAGKREADDTFMHQMRDEGKHIQQDQQTWVETDHVRAEIAERLRELIG